MRCRPGPAGGGTAGRRPRTRVPSRFGWTRVASEAEAGSRRGGLEGRGGRHGGEKLPSWLPRRELGRLWPQGRHYLPGCAAGSYVGELLQGAPRCVCGAAGGPSLEPRPGGAPPSAEVGLRERFMSTQIERNASLRRPVRGILTAQTSRAGAWDAGRIGTAHPAPSGRRRQAPIETSHGPRETARAGASCWRGPRRPHRRLTSSALEAAPFMS
jgi:hypothetical protein